MNDKIKAVIWPMPGENLTGEEVKEFCAGGKILKKELLDK